MWITTIYHPDFRVVTPGQKESIPAGYQELDRLKNIDGNGISLPGFTDEEVRTKIQNWVNESQSGAPDAVLKRAWNTEDCARAWADWFKEKVPESTVSVEESTD
jgi:hypothetical protein